VERTSHLSYSTPEQLTKLTKLAKRTVTHSKSPVATVRCPEKEVRDMVMSTGMATGAGRSYDQLADLIVARVINARPVH